MIKLLEIEVLTNLPIKLKALPYYNLRMCLNCEKNFIPPSKEKRKRKYCSDLCRKDDVMRKAKANRRKSMNEPKTCLYCEKTFKLGHVRAKLQKFCSKECKIKNWSKKDAEFRKEKRRRLKTEIVTKLGGKCQICGWNKWLSALDFHHVEELNKRQQIRDKTEIPLCKEFDLSKCIILCANCHRRIHSELKNDKETQNQLKNLLMENNKKIEAEKASMESLKPI